jgi:hypothetical protein
MIVGCSVLLFAALGLLHNPLWLAGNLLTAVILIVTSLTDRCVLHDFLIRLGVKEREEIFLPGGALRPEVQDALKSHKVV